MSGIVVVKKLGGDARPEPDQVGGGPCEHVRALVTLASAAGVKIAVAEPAAEGAESPPMTVTCEPCQLSVDVRSLP